MMMIIMPTIERETREDLADVLALIAAGLELYSGRALLRPVVVDASVQGQGLGQRLTEAALTLARAHRMPTVFLLSYGPGS